VTEKTPLKEVESPYGRTKSIAEQIIKDVYNVLDGKSILLRYFNPAGAHETAKIGESPINPPQNLVPVITETAIGRREKLVVFGDDYNTRDGSCLRDFIHVMDLANAHTKAIQYLINNTDAPKIDVFNLGIGEGVTVLEAIHSFEKINNIKLNYEIGPRREGDVIAIYADKSKSENILKWKPSRNIDEIMLTSWQWEVKRSQQNN
ncbi:MAG: GDP-mannose 4,6-dehydratase, partial [Bacteroidota bacterium]